MHCLIVLSSELTRLPSPDLRSSSPELCPPALLINNRVAYTSNVMSPLICYSDRKHTEETGGLRVGELHLCHSFLFKQNYLFVFICLAAVGLSCSIWNI